MAAFLVSVTGQAASAAPREARAPIGGIGTATSMGAVNLASLADAPEVSAITPAIPSPAMAVKASHKVALPTKSVAGTKPGTEAGKVADKAPGGPNSTGGTLNVAPNVAPPVVNNFEALNNAVSCGCQPPDVNAAVGVSQVVETVNLRLQVFNKAGAQVCAGTSLNTFLGTTDSLSDPRVQYDNINARWTFNATVIPASGTAVPALWVAASQNSNGCGGWFRFRVTFAGGSFPAGTLLDYPILGQDRNAIFIATDNFTPTSENFTVFGIPKSAIYAGAGFSFSAFNTASLVAPASNGGIPMIATTFNYFLGAVPGVGYRFYRMTNSGGAGATLTLQATIASAFTAPPRQIFQPGTTNTLDPLDGRIVWSPVNDGNFIWFAHGINIGGFPGVRYGAVGIATNAATVALAFRSGTSDDFNPSVGVGNSPTGGNFIFLNWAFTDTPNNIPTSHTVDSVNPGGGVPNLIGTSAVLATGSSTTTQFRFGDYSSSTIDPTNANGSCALTAQQIFAANGTWRTRIARVGTC